MRPRIAALALALGGLISAYAFAERPWMLRWGATDREVRAVLVGDDVVPGATQQATRALTIAAPVDRVWPWLAQLGQDRGGFYSYEVLENLAGCRMRNADRILPWAQEWRDGDSLWMYPRERAGGAGGVPLVRFVPGRTLVFASRHFGTPPDAPLDGTWTLTLQPIDARSTRFLVRDRGGGSHVMPSWTAIDRVVFEPVHFAMERRMMTGLRDRAEGRVPSPLTDVVPPLLWTVVFVVFWVSVLRVLIARRWGRAVAIVVASGALFQLLTLVQPHPILATGLVVALGALVVFLARHGRHPMRSLAASPGSHPRRAFGT